VITRLSRRHSQLQFASQKIGRQGGSATSTSLSCARRIARRDENTSGAQKRNFVSRSPSRPLVPTYETGSYQVKGTMFIGFP
jgi:hypothetical protein